MTGTQTEGTPWTICLMRGGGRDAYVCVFNCVVVYIILFLCVHMCGGNTCYILSVHYCHSAISEMANQLVHHQ